MLVKTYPSIYSFIVENWEYSWNGWVAAMNSIPDNYIGTSGAVIALKNRKIRQRFVELAHILYDDTRTSKGLVRYLRTMIRINPEEMAWIEQSLSSELRRAHHCFSRYQQIVFSMMKLRFRGELSSRRYREQMRELLMVVLHNIGRVNFLECAGRCFIRLCLK
jgi:hypothetical protein